eukprot:g3325.t1
MPRRGAKSKFLKELNTRPKNATRYADQLFWSSVAEKGVHSQEAHILGTLAYMASVAFYAGKTPSDFVKELELHQKAPNLGFQELMTDGTTITHVNKTELKRNISWVVKVHLKNALHVIDKDFMIRDESDPFVVFKTGVSMAKSEVKYDAVNATWNSTHYLFIRKRSILKDENDRLKVYLFDGDKMVGRDGMSLNDMQKFDDLIASTEIDLGLDKGDTGLKDHPITFNDRRNRFAQRMTLNFSTQLLTFDDFCNDIGKAGDEYWLDTQTLQNPTVDWVKLFDEVNMPHVDVHPSLCFESKATSTQGWIHTIRKKKVVIVAFKGTDVTEFKDIITDLKMLPGSLDPLSKDEFILRPSQVLQRDENRIHMGFRDAYASVRESILEIVYSITGWNKDWLVVLTGHSLGGALATVAAFETANRWLNGKRPRVAMMNYGSPRLANDAFVDSYVQTVPVSFRFRHCSDAIPCFPPNLHHVDHVVKGNYNGTITIVYHESEEKSEARNLEEDRDDDTLREAIRNRPDIAHHQQSAYYSQMKQVISKIFSRSSK